MKADSSSPEGGISRSAADLHSLAKAGDKIPETSAAQLANEAPAGALASDILYGAEQIAEFVYGDKRYRRKVYNLIVTGRMPHFRLGVIVCARRTVLLKWIASQEAIEKMRWTKDEARTGP